MLKSRALIIICQVSSVAVSVDHLWEVERLKKARRRILNNPKLFLQNLNPQIMLLKVLYQLKSRTKI
jgi:hypothetical protein